MLAGWGNRVGGGQLSDGKPGDLLLGGKRDVHKPFRVCLQLSVINMPVLHVLG